MSTNRLSGNTWADLEEFTQKGAKSSTIRATITPKFTTILSSGLIRKMGKVFENNSHVVLHYSKANKAIVMEFTTDSNRKGALKLIKNHNCAISFNGFLKHYNLANTSVQGSYQPELINIPGMGNQWTIFLFA